MANEGHATAGFAGRHIGSDARRAAGDARRARARSRPTELVDRVVPESIRTRDPLGLPAALDEVEALDAVRALADRNQVYRSLIGLGYSDTVTPPVILRNVLENPAWYTAYTPYQPEISQGRLEALLNFQTMVSDLTGMDIANASLLDEGTAAAEAMALCHRLNPKAGNVFFVDADTHPQTIEVVATRAEPIGIEVVVGDPETDLPADLAGCGGVRGPAAAPGQQRGAPRPAPGDRAGEGGRRARRGRERPARARAVHAAGGDGCRRRGGIVAALRRAARVRRARTPASSPPATRTSAASPAGSSGCRSTARVAPRCASRSRPASSTSGGRRRRATSAPRRSSSR